MANREARAYVDNSEQSQSLKGESDKDDAVDSDVLHQAVLPLQPANESYTRRRIAETAAQLARSSRLLRGGDMSGMSGAGVFAQTARDCVLHHARRLGRRAVICCQETRADMTEVTHLFAAYREAARHLWNSAFYRPDADLAGGAAWDRRERFGRVAEELFTAMILEPLGVEDCRLPPELALGGPLSGRFEPATTREETRRIARAAVPL
jgi:hypothetical protein